jgi:hypothetical protein
MQPLHGEKEPRNAGAEAGSCAMKCRQCTQRGSREKGREKCKRTKNKKQRQ